MASWRLSYTSSVIYDSSDLEEEEQEEEKKKEEEEKEGHDCDYSVSEISERFTFR